MANDKYFWFRFRDDFFEAEQIIQMECEPGGYEYESIYFKLFSFSTKSKGIYIPPQQINPYGQKSVDVFAMSKKLRHTPEMVKKALEYFHLHGLMDIRSSDDSGTTEYIFEYVKSNVGKPASARADRVRAERREEAKELKEKEERNMELPLLEAERKELTSYGFFKNVNLTNDEYNSLREELDNIDEVIQKVSRHKALTGIHVENDYAYILEYDESEHQEKNNDKEMIPYKHRGELFLYGEFKNVKLTHDEYNNLNAEFDNADEVIQKVSRYKAISGKYISNDYAYVLQFADKDGVKRAETSAKNEKIYERCLREASIGCEIQECDKAVLTVEQVEEIEEELYTWKRRHNLI